MNQLEVCCWLFTPPMYSAVKYNATIFTFVLWVVTFHASFCRHYALMIVGVYWLFPLAKLDLRFHIMETPLDLTRISI